MKKRKDFDIFNNDFAFSEKKIKSRQAYDDGEGFGITETDEKISLTVSPKNLAILAGVFFLFFAIIVGRLFSLQISQGEYFRSLSEGNRIKEERLKAMRGLIYDSYGQSLVENNPRFTLLFFPRNAPLDQAARQKIAEDVAGVLNKPVKDILDLLNNGLKNASSPEIISDEINYEQALTLDVKISKQPSLVLEIGLERRYLNDNQTFAHLIGYVGEMTKEEWETKKDQNYRFDDYLGKSGLESWYEEVLKGSDGYKKIEVNALGERKKIIQEKTPQTGEDLYLAIDSRLQQQINNVLIRHGIKKGAVIALNPKNGEILSLVSFPAFDNNLFVNGKDSQRLAAILTDQSKPLFNRTIMAQYPSGSTFKPVVAAAGLEELVIKESTMVLSTGGLKINQWFYPDWQAGGHGWVNVEKALADSVNTFFYYVGGGYGDFKGLGVDLIVKYAREFGLGKELGIDLSGEKAGFLPTKPWKEKAKGEQWYIGDTYHLAIGQGDILVTPLQVTAYIAAIVNGGILYQPHLVRKIVDSQDKTEILINPKVINSGFIKKENLETVKKGLRLAVSQGSAQSLNSLPAKVGAKTGTAQVGGNELPHAWLTAFGPYDDPAIVLTVVVENGGEGSAVATPVARDILNWFFGNSRFSASP